MQVYEKLITVQQDDLDYLNHVNNVRYVQWVQDVAGEHWLSKASAQILDNYFWVMVSHHIQYKGQAFLNDVLLLKTFVVKSEGISSTRRVEIYNKISTKLLATSETIWCFMSKENNRPTRITEEIVGLFE